MGRYEGDFIFKKLMQEDSSSYVLDHRHGDELLRNHLRKSIDKRRWIHDQREKVEAEFYMENGYHSWEENSYDDESYYYDLQHDSPTILERIRQTSTECLEPAKSLWKKIRQLSCISGDQSSASEVVHVMAQATSTPVSEYSENRQIVLRAQSGMLCKQMFGA